MEQQDLLRKENNLKFIKLVAKYFMDFLETDFHKRKNPKRCIKLHNESNLLIGINLAKYPSFSKTVCRLIGTAFNKATFNKIKRNTFKTNIPDNLLKLIEVLVSNIENQQIYALIGKFSNLVKQAAILHKKEYNNALLYTLENSKGIIKKELVLPFVNQLEKPLESQDNRSTPADFFD
jgi:hypothetical protein